MLRISWDEIGGDKPYYINRFDLEGDFRFQPHDHSNHWEIVYVVSGSFLHRINGGKKTQKEGNMVLIRDRDIHSLKGRGFSYVNLAFPPLWLERLGDLCALPNLRARLDALPAPLEAWIPEAEREYILKRFDQLLAGSENGRGLHLFPSVLGLLCTYLDPWAYPSASDLSEQSRDYQPTTSPFAQPGPPRWLSDLVRWSSSRQRPPSYVEFIQKSGYTAAYVIRSFRRAYGQTPNRFLIDLRLKRSEDLLRYTNYSLDRICAECAWGDARSFERHLKRRAGLSPREFRKKHALLAH